MLTRKKIKKSILLLILILLGLISFSPFYFMLITSVKTEADYLEEKLFPPGKLVVDSYTWAILESNIFRFLLNSILVLIATIVPYVFMSSAAGFAFAKLKFPFRTGLLLLVSGIMIFPQMVLGVQLYSVLASLRLLNTHFGLVLSYLGYFAPYAAYLMTIYYRNIPQTLLEAARIDGANLWKIYTYIMLPIAKPMIVTIIIVGSQAVWNELSFSFLLLRTTAKRTIMAGIVMLQGQYGIPIPYSCAVFIVASLPMVMLYIFFQRQIQQGVLAGGIKE